MALNLDELVLGKLPKKDDDRNLRFARYVSSLSTQRKPKASVSRIKLVSAWQMFANDELGDCTCATVGHIETLDSIAAGQPEVPNEQDIRNLYWATGSSDSGRMCLDVLRYWQTHGVGPRGTELLAYVEIDPKNLDHVKLAMELFGSVYAGVQLPNSAKAQTGKGAWTVTRGGDAEPGGWGGHCIPLFDYSTRGGPVCVTWAQPQRMTWQWWKTYADEAYAPISADWFNADGVAPGGFKLAQLQKDLAAIQR